MVATQWKPKIDCMVADIHLAISNVIIASYVRAWCHVAQRTNGSALAMARNSYSVYIARLISFLVYGSIFVDQIHTTVLWINFRGWISYHEIHEI